MNLVLMPMWLLSGAFFPIPILATDATFGQTVMHTLMRLNPLTYPVAGMRHSMLPQVTEAHYWAPSLQTSWGVTLLFVLATTIAATWVVQRNAKGEIS